MSTKKLSQLLMLFVALVTFSLSSCKQAAPMAVDALNGEWQIVEVGGKEVVGESTPYIGINIAEAKLYGSNSCNRLNGLVVLDENQTAGVISFDNVATTMMMCANSPMEQEIMNAINQVAAYGALSQDGTLELYNGDKELVMKVKQFVAEEQ